MKPKGFTLIELLAVIVILAIIALIAVPIVLNIINDAKNESNKRSVDMYAKAVENAVATYQLKEGKEPESIAQLNDLGYLQYDGSQIECNINGINKDGSIYLSECKVGDKEVKDETTEDGMYQYGKITAIMKLLSKVNSSEIKTYTKGDVHQMYTFDHQKTIQTEELTDYRYIGNNPYNYVKFNNDEIWRIVGVFTVEDDKGNKEQRIKIIKEKSIGAYAFDDDADGIYTNDWKTSSLNNYLNGEYYNSLSDEAKSMISKTKYYLGGKDKYENLSGSDYYAFERGEEVCENNSINWTGNIALMYPSDYVYTYALGVDDILYSDGSNSNSSPLNGWLYKNNDNDGKRLIFHYSEHSSFVFLVDSTGKIKTTIWSGHYTVGSKKETYPTLYLNSNIKIISGDGSEENPYKLKI